MTYPSYIVNAFTKDISKGNPAAVCLIPQALQEENYQKIAADFNLSETAFPVPLDSSLDYKTSKKFSLRWFTPTNEVPLCGHATLATAHVLFNEIGNENDEIHFETKSGVLTVKKDGNGNLEMNFPKYELTLLKFDDLLSSHDNRFPEMAAPPFLIDVIHCVIPNKISMESVIYAPKYGGAIVIIDPETTKAEFESFKIDSKKALELHDGSFVRGISISLRPSNPLAQGFIDESGEAYDYACRYFGPWDGVNEDPATGSAQCSIAPYWAVVTKKEKLYGFQAFPGRGAQFRIRIQGDRVILNGSSVTVQADNLNHD
uniref:Phenazine biosynthesis-like domain-containing protein 1 n=1 Tax=Caenorhabditis tropicalis TaxID=1561998 RepID=A0A1I7V2C7_9PELO